jgi:hypothetical protein
MSVSACPLEQETLAVVQAGRWPDGCDNVSRAHVDACPICGDIVRVASLVAADYQATLRTARVPNSGLVWWRMQRRARQEAVRTASRVITIVQAIAVAAGVAIAMGIIAAASRSFSPAPAEISTTIVAQWGIPLLIALAAWLTLAPVAVYFAVSKD